MVVKFGSGRVVRGSPTRLGYSRHNTVIQVIAAILGDRDDKREVHWIR